MTVDAAKRKKWKQMESGNASRTLSKVKPLLLQLGFRAVTRNTYRIDVNGRTCKFGITKLSLTPRFRVIVSVEGNTTCLLLSDRYHKFSFDVSRFKDNSEECADQIARFTNSVAMPWLREHAKRER